LGFFVGIDFGAVVSDWMVAKIGNAVNGDRRK
jgi:hypothetical protein